jgi:acetyltransferase
MMVEDAVFEGVCAQAGLVRVYETNRLFDMAEALASAPLPKGRNVGIVSMTGGNAVVCSDTCSYLGLEVPELDENTKNYLSKNILAAHAPSPSNPIDLAGDFSTPLLHARCAEALAELNYIHGLIVTPPGLSSASGAEDKIVIEAVSRIAAIPQQYGKPVLALGRRSADNEVTRILHDAGIPLYQSPEDGAYAMKALVSYAEFRLQG